jgi:hypothetical protein
LLRFVVLSVAIAFITLMTILTALDFSDNGVTLVGVLGAGVVLVCAIGILGALLQPPRK